MYFESRAVAGAKLAAELIDKYRWLDSAVLALDKGGVAVGYQIAVYLHATLQQLLTETIHINDESIDYATVMQGGVVAKNPELTEAQSQYYYGEYAGQLDDEIRQASSRINRMLGDGGEVRPEILRGRNVILVADALNSGTMLEAAVEWMKPLRTARLILACPVISVPALDRAHILVDELHILGVTANFISTDHYFDNNDVPDEKMAQRMIDATILGWK
ncbi:hypothetical protein FWG95_02725 [Candidatus Saccharibacteria bacterium]|nr:hypothetical protein [Candidatus Saccharibacteria bacterium]